MFDIFLYDKVNTTNRIVLTVVDALASSGSLMGILSTIAVFLLRNIQGKLFYRKLATK